jgi:metal-responsive CopG/Arc/MetJ family transcriptional regulator
MSSRAQLLPPSRAVHVTIPLEILAKLDQAVAEQKIPRSEIIRQALVRDLMRTETQSQSQSSGWTLLNRKGR